MDKKEFIVNEVGLQIAREKVAMQIAELMKDKKQANFKEKMAELLEDRDEIYKGNEQVIEKYIGGI